VYLHNIDPRDRCYDFKKFSPKKLAKILAKILAYFAQTAATFCKNWLLRKTAIFSAENWQKSQKMWP
jgi:hypothetical protein